MSRFRNGCVWVGVIVAVGFLFGDFNIGNATAALTTNSWNSVASGLWATAGSWSAGVIPGTGDAIDRIVNGGTSKIVTINAATPAGSLTITNLLISNAGHFVNTLQITNAPASTLHILNALTITSGGALLVTNSKVRVDGTAVNSFTPSFIDDGNVTVLTGGLIVSTNYATVIGNTNSGNFTVSGGTWLARRVDVGNHAGSEGTLTVAGGTNIIAEFFQVGVDANATGAVWLTGGLLVVTNEETIISGQGAGQMTVSNGTWVSRDLHVGSFGGPQGVLTVAGGTNTIMSQLNVGNGTSSTGSVWVTGGLLTTTNQVGISGTSQMTVSNGTWQAGLVFLGGTLTVAGGTSTFSTALRLSGTLWLTGGQVIGNEGIQIGNGGAGQMIISNGTCQTPSSAEVVGGSDGGTLLMAGGTNITILLVASETGTVWMTGGQLITTNIITGIPLGAAFGPAGVGQMTISNGVWRANAVYVGGNSFVGFGQGTLTSAGGKTSIYTNLTIGDPDCVGVGVVAVVPGGEIQVTNVTGTAILEIDSGTLTQTGGLLDVDRLIITNACARFIRSGGSLFTGFVDLPANLDADGDSLPNGWEQANGFDPYSPVGDQGAEGDPDHDGMNNYAEFAAGTNPHDPNSVLRITSALREGNDIRITWTTVTNKTYRVLASFGDGNGNYTNNFINYSSFITATTSGESTTNYLDVGAATNVNARYYRVKVLP